VPDLRLGIDVGGTNTDAVVVDAEQRLLGKAKVATSADVAGGIRHAIDSVLANAAVPTERISHVMLGTSHATNAIIERRGLRRVAVLRIGAPATLSVPPLSGWPAALRALVAADSAVIRGGVEFDGRELAPFDGEAARRFFESISGRAEAVAITAVFSDISPEHERLAADIAAELLGDIPISVSNEIGSLGLIERENATVLNAALGGVAHNIAMTLAAALEGHSLKAATFFAQNDGTLMALDFALRYPVLTIGSGTANSMRGAAYLSGISEAIVVDAGGTSTDVGSLINSFPRESTSPIDVGGVRTNFRMPDLVSLAVGGGSVIRRDQGGVRVGPQSVGYRLSEEALAFGGSTATLSDAAVALQRTSLGGSAGPVRQRRTFGEALAKTEQLIGEAIDRVKSRRGEQPLIATGGASFLVGDSLFGVSEVVRPEHHEVANAIGAVMAPVAGYVDSIFRFSPAERARVLDEAYSVARSRAVQAGADPARTDIVDVEEIPVAYVSEPAVRIRVKASGPLGSI
jgi:N-methylhydantoinase A/oxoprolinase/acetone carboxylase beta subunit